MTGQPGKPLTIPPSAVSQGSTAFLNGNWRSITGLQDRSGAPVELNYSLNKGQGTVTLNQARGGQKQTCSGTAASQMQNGQLVISQTGIRCPDGTQFLDSQVKCTVGAGGKAVCRGVNADGTNYDVNIVQ